MSNIDNHITITEILHQNISKPYKVLQWEPVKRTMTYPDFVATFPRDERIKHCNFAEIEKDEGHTHAVGKSSGSGSSKDKVGQILRPRCQTEAAKKNLKNFILDEYNIELIGPQTHHFPVCHLCTHNSKITKKDSNKHTCTNQFHVYFGTAKENEHDKDPVTKSLTSSRTGSEAAKSPKHACRVRGKCPHCGWETTEVSLKGNHIPSCHFNPDSYNYLKPILRNDRKKGYQQQGLGHKLIELELMINQAYNQRHS